MAKKEELEALKEEMERADLPLKGNAQLVFGEGNPDSEVMFIGEAPGFHEDRLGRPFVGIAGKLLNKLIAEIKWRREDVYISNIVKRRPPENRDPLPEEIEAYQPYLERQIKIINPKAIVPLGRFSMNYFLPEGRISRDQGKVFTVSGRKIIPMFHPAAALRAGAVLQSLTESFKRIPLLLGDAPLPEPPPAEDNPERDRDRHIQKLF